MCWKCVGNSPRVVFGAAQVDLGPWVVAIICGVCWVPKLMEKRPWGDRWWCQDRGRGERGVHLITFGALSIFFAFACDNGSMGGFGLLMPCRKFFINFFF